MGLVLLVVVVTASVPTPVAIAGATSVEGATGADIAATLAAELVVAV